VRSTGPGKRGTFSKRGRHHRPSQVKQAARRAGLAAPVVAVTGALAAAGPQALAATAQGQHLAAAPGTAQVATARLDAAVQAQQPTRTHTVQSGDTLAAIAQRYYGFASDWRYLYKVNKSEISDPNLIYVGQVLNVPADPPASVLNGTYRGRHVTTSATSAGGSNISAANTADVSQASGSGSQSSGSSSASLSSAVQQDIASGNNLLAVAQYLVENGYSDAAAAGIASCVDGESGGNPESVGSGGGGLIGWTPIGSAAPNANIITGNVAQDMMTQLADILSYNANEIGQSLIDQLNGISDPVAAADFYSQNFEKPAVTDSDVVASVAEQIYGQLTS
jgi:LysM repeat protein